MTFTTLLPTNHKTHGEGSIGRCRFLPIYLCIISLLCVSCVTRKSASLPLYSRITSPVGVRYLQPPTAAELDSLRHHYGRHKVLLDEYAEIILVALSYYPELQDTHIRFEYSNEQTTMASRPASIFHPRTYRVLINNDKDFTGIPLDSIPYNAAIGIVGHELAHIVDYERLTALGLLDRLLLYAHSARGKAYFERSIDLMTIDRGLGWQLYDWAMYAMYENQIATKEYKQFKEKTYLTPQQIKEYIRHYEMYSSHHPTNSHQ